MKLLHRRDSGRTITPAHEPHPRTVAKAYIAELVSQGRAGLDPYDRSLLILDADPFERVWANRALELVGLIPDYRMWAGRLRYRATISAAIRAELGLDAADAPTVEDEPLASRAVEARPTLQLIENA
jgi:hypothetical protein